MEPAGIVAAGFVADIVFIRGNPCGLRLLAAGACGSGNRTEPIVKDCDREMEVV